MAEAQRTELAQNPSSRLVVCRVICNGDSILHLAVRSGYRELVEFVLAHNTGFDINSRNGEGDTALHVAVKNYNSNIVRLLVNHASIDIDIYEQNWLPIHFAIRNNNLAMVKLFPLQHILTNAVTAPDRNTCLHLAAQFGHLQIVEYILENDGDPNSANIDGLTPLHFAARKGHLKMVEFLVEHSADVNSMDSLKRSCMNIAILSNKNEIIEYLLNTKKLTQDSIDKGLNCAVRDVEGHLELVKCLVEEHQADVNATNQIDDLTPIYSALVEVRMAIVNYLLTKELTTESINQVFERAVQKDHLDVIKCLVERHQADVNLAFTDEFRRRTFNHFYWFGISVAKYLLNTNKLTTRSLNQHLLDSALLNRLELVKCLVENHQVDVNVTNGNDETPLQLGIKHNCPEVIEYLLNTNRITPENINRSLISAAHSGCLELVKKLVEQHQADVNTTDKDNKTPLESAIQRHCSRREGTFSSSSSILVDVVNYLLSTKKMTPDSINRCLITAAKKGFLEIVQCLVEKHQADVNTTDEDHKTPMELATQEDHTEVVMYLTSPKRTRK